jgi:hypothetical protein
MRAGFKTQFCALLRGARAAAVGPACDFSHIARIVFVLHWLPGQGRGLCAQRKLSAPEDDHGELGTFGERKTFEAAPTRKKLHV